MMASDVSWNSIASLMTSWLLTYALHSTLLLVLAWLLTRRGTFASHHIAETIWKAAMVGGVITASVQTLAILGIVPLGEHLNVAGISAPGFFHALSSTVAVPTQADRLMLAVREPQPTSLEWPLWVCGLWVIGASIGMARWLIVRRRLETYLQRCKRRPMTGSPLSMMLRRLCRMANIRYRVQLTSSSRLLSPIALDSREICVPERAVTDLSLKQQESMLAHELAHITRRDPVWRLAAEIIGALLFFQPLNVVASRQLKELAEYLCDDWAVRQTGRHLSLAQCLAEVATWIQQQAQPIGAVGLTGKPSLLVDRVTRLVEPSGRRGTTLSAFWGRLIMGGVLLAIIGLVPVVSVSLPIEVAFPSTFGAGARGVFYIRTDTNAFVSGSLSGTFQQAIPMPGEPLPPPSVPVEPSAP